MLDETLARNVRQVLAAVEQQLRTVDEDTAHDAAVVDRLDQLRADQPDERLRAEASLNVLLAAALRLARGADAALSAVRDMLARPLPEEEIDVTGDLARQRAMVDAAVRAARRYDTGEDPPQRVQAALVGAAHDAYGEDWDGVTFSATVAAAHCCTILDVLSSEGEGGCLPDDEAVRGHLVELAEMLGVDPPAAAR